MGNTEHVFIRSILLKNHTQNYHSTSLGRRMRGWRVCPTTLLKLPQSWVTCIEKGDPNNFA